MTFVPGSSSRLRRFCKAQGADRLDLLVVEVGAEHDVGEDLQGRDQVAAEGRGREAGVQRLGALAVADAQVVERREQLAAVAVAGASGDPLGEHRGRARPAPRGSYAAPAGSSSVNAADCTPGIASATSTRPLGYSCCESIGMRARGPRGQSAVDGDGPTPSMIAMTIRSQARRPAVRTDSRPDEGPQRTSRRQPSTALYRVLARRKPTLAVEPDGGASSRR